MTLSHLVEGMVGRGHDVTVVRPRQLEGEQLDARKGYDEVLVRGVPIPGYRMLRLGLPARGELLRCWSGIKRPDLVHIATEGPLGYSALSAANRLKIPVSSSFHTNFHSYSRHYGFPFLARAALGYLRHFHNRTRATLAPTAELNAELALDGFKNLRLLSRGVNTRVFSPTHRSHSLRQRYGVGPQDLLVVHVSRLAREKNYPLLLQSFTAIAEKLPRSKFVIVSDGPLRASLARTNPQIHFTGFLPRSVMAEHYASADLFLFASLTETFGNVVTEAMASGLPVVAFNYAAAARFISHRHNGWLVPLDDRPAFLEASVRVACDPALRRIMSHHARKTAEGISWQNVIEGLERDFLELAEMNEATGVGADRA